MPKADGPEVASLLAGLASVQRAANHRLALDVAVSWPSLSRYRLSTLARAAMRVDRRRFHCQCNLGEHMATRDIYCPLPRPRPPLLFGIRSSSPPSSSYHAAASLIEASLFAPHAVDQPKGYCPLIDPSTSC